MIEIFKYEKGYWYPHMKPRDVAIWERFLLAFPNAYEQCQYDFAVGDIPAHVLAEPEQNYAGMAELYKLKIDVIGHIGGELHIIEVKPEASPASIGQVQGYTALYTRDESPTKPLKSVIITDTERPNMKYLCEQAGVLLYVV